MRTKGILLSIVIGIFISCQTPSEKKELTVFTPPVIINSQFNDSIKSTPYKAESITGVHPAFVGKFKFLDTIDINPEKRDTSFDKDFVDEFKLLQVMDSVDVNGLELVVDYHNTVKYDRSYNAKHPFRALHDQYPVYFINSTKSDKFIFGKDHYVFGFQEAEDYREWKPIEKRGIIMCGNGHWGLIVHPQEFVLVLMRKYDGDYETKIRTRFMLGENVLLSRPFKGRIDKRQFNEQDHTD